MRTLRRIFVVMSSTAMIGLFLVACGGVQPTANGTGSMAKSTTYPMMGTSTPTMHPTPTPKPTMSAMATPTMMTDNGNMSAFIHTAFVMLNGKSVHVLTNNKGFLLYYDMRDMMLSSTCTGACAKTWPPLLEPKGMMTITSSIALPRKLSIHMTANGNQIFYDGHALYTYVGDTQAGQFTGRGMGSVWYLVGFTL